MKKLVKLVSNCLTWTVHSIHRVADLRRAKLTSHVKEMGVVLGDVCVKFQQSFSFSFRCPKKKDWFNEVAVSVNAHTAQRVLVESDRERKQGRIADKL